MLNKQRIIALRPGDPDTLVGTIYPGQFNNNQVSAMGTNNYGFFQNLYTTQLFVLSSSAHDVSTQMFTARLSEGNLDNFITASCIATGSRSP